MNKKNVRLLGILVIVIVIMAGLYKISDLGIDQETTSFTAFMAVPGDNKSKKNRIHDKITQITGVSAEVEWLSGQTPEEKIETMISTGEYPDFINGADAASRLVEAGALVPLEDYLEDYPHLYQYLTPKQ